VALAHSGPVGIETARRPATSCLIDLGMPGMNALEVDGAPRRPSRVAAGRRQRYSRWESRRRARDRSSTNSSSNPCSRGRRSTALAAACVDSLGQRWPTTIFTMRPGSSGASHRPVISRRVRRDGDGRAARARRVVRRSDRDEGDVLGLHVRILDHSGVRAGTGASRRVPACRPARLSPYASTRRRCAVFNEDPVPCNVPLCVLAAERACAAVAR